MEVSLLRDIVAILALAVGVVLLFRRFQLPVILGFLITGLIAGPSGLHLVGNEESISFLSEIGVILLLFVIGLEFSIKELIAIKRTVLIGGGFQVLFTIGLVTGLAFMFGLPFAQSVFLGFCVSLSSTAIVLRVLQESNQMTSPLGRNALGILIFQDIVVVPLMLVTPLLAGEGGNLGMELLWLFGKLVMLFAILWASSRFILPRLLDTIAATKSREIFVLSSVLLCMSFAELTHFMGLSLALGAFLAGLLISESTYSHQITGTILPFRELFTSFFFVSIGMLLDIQFLWGHWFYIIPLSLVIGLIKMFSVFLSIKILRYPIRTSILTAFALFQVGEFAFVLSNIGANYGLLAGEVGQYFLSISVLSMGITPFLMGRAHKMTDGFLSRFGIKNKTFKQDSEISGQHWLNDHLVIIGYGLNGSNLALAAKNAGIPYVILDLNSQRVKAEKDKGEPIFFGDAANLFVLEHLRVYQARVAVVAISDPEATRRIVSGLRSISKSVTILVRTRFVREIDGLIALGADEVIPEEFETSVEIFTRVLNRYLVPEDDIDSFVHAIRNENYQMLRPIGSMRPKAKSNLSLPDLRMTCIRVNRFDSNILGLSLQQTEIRQRFAVNLVAIQRQNELIHRIEGTTKLEFGDLLYVMGKPEAVIEFSKAVAD